METFHLLGEIRGSFQVLNDLKRIEEECVSACQVAGAKVLSVQSHQFEPQGVTVLILLAESHLSIHTFPEAGSAAVDLFTCGAHTDPEKGFYYLCDALNCSVQCVDLCRRMV